MRKKISLFLIIFSILMTPFIGVKAESLAEKLQGRILLQVEQNGEAWFVSPQNLNRYFLGRPADAFSVMRELGLGISNDDFNRFESNMPEKLLGKILIKVEDSGKAYYIYPIDKKPYFLGRPTDAFSIMRELGLGITDLSLNEIIEDESSVKRRAQNQTQNQTQAQNGSSDKNNEDSQEKEELNKEISDTATSTVDTATSTEEIASSTEEIEEITGSQTCEFLAEYFKDETISGVANYKESVTGLNFNWGNGNPEMLGNFYNKFSIRYTGNCYFEAGTYEFTAFYNDGIEATLDNYWLFKDWKDRNFEKTSYKTLKVEEGYHKIKVEYYDKLGDASIGLDWVKTE